MNQKYLRKENEDDLDYSMRLVAIKKEERPEDLDWSDICELLGLDLNKDSLRKSQDTIFGGISVYNQMKNRMVNDKDKDYKDAMQVEIQELKKERMRISDERAALNRKLREKVREESLSEIAKKCANTIAEKYPFKINVTNRVPNYRKSAVLTLSDIHYGLTIDEFNNTYNSEICVERLNKITEKTIEILKLHKIDYLYILGLGDYISGIIRTITRIENRETIIEQIIQFSEILSDFINNLSEYATIWYYDVTDNHGRVFEKKEDNLNKDNFCLLIKWYLKSRFEDHPMVNIMDNEIDENIGTVEIFNKNYCFTHGHNDKIGSIVQNISLMTKKFYEAAFIGHCHHFEANEVHGTYIYMNGSFAGADGYSNNLRITSNPSQNLFIIDSEKGIECQYLIKL